MSTADAKFPTTSWTLIARIKSPDADVAARALDELCAQYHYPLYCYLRRRGCEHHDAQDVLHDFLATMLRRHDLERLDEARGRLRGFLATSLGRHLQRWQRGEQRRYSVGSVSREGGDPAQGADAALDFDAIEDRYQREHFTDADTPDRVFERKWAYELFRQVMEKLAARYEERGRAKIFAALRPALEAGGSLRGEDVQAIARQLGLSEEATRGAMSRLLGEFREQMQAEVRLTVETADEVAEELVYLMGLFRR